MHNAAHQVTLRFADGVEHVVKVGPCETILDAAITQEAPVLFQCRSGSCSSCTCKLVEGEASNRPGTTSVLMESEFKAGQRLMCVSQADSDCTIELAYNSTASAAVGEAHAFIDSVERIASNVMRLKLELAEEQYLDFKPGQYLQFSVPGAGVTRSYSPASTAQALPNLEMLIRLQPGGAMSTWLEQGAQPDDVIKMEGPFGAFYLRDDNRRAPHIFVAGGTGLAPILSMIDGMRQWPGRKPPILLNFGCSKPQDLFAEEDLALRRQWMPTLETRICVSNGATGEQLPCNPVQALQASDVTSPDTVAYLCGPEGMMNAARERLIALGVAPENIHSEVFTPSL